MCWAGRAFSLSIYILRSPCSTSFSADTSKWLRADFAVELMRHVSVGPGGIFAVKAKDDSVWYRTYEQAGKPTGKVLPDTDHGVLWNKIQVGEVSALVSPSPLD